MDCSNARSRHLQERLSAEQSQAPNGQGLRRGTAPTTAICSVIRARLLLLFLSDSRAAQAPERTEKPERSLTTGLVRSKAKLVYIDTTFVLSKSVALAADETISRLEFLLLYTLGALSFAATCVGTIVAQIDVAKGSRSSQVSWIPVCSLVGTLAFSCHVGRFYHRTLLLLLFRSFDVVFCSLQFLAGVLLLCVLYHWDVRSINLISWSIWFHWILAFDALTPPVRAHLRLKKLAATPVALFILYGLGGPFVLLYGYPDTKLRDRILFGHSRVSTLLLARLLTLAMWIAHLVWDLGVQDDDEFIFLRDPVEYALPVETASRGAVHPTQTTNSPILTPQPSTTPHPSPELAPSPSLQ